LKKNIEEADIKEVKVENTEPKEVEVDKTIYFTSLITIVVVCGFCIIFPDLALRGVEIARHFMVTNFDWLFMFLGVAVLIVTIFLAVSRYGNIRLSVDDEKPEFGFWSWLFMIYFSAIGSSTLLWGICEPLAFLIKPPFNYQPFSEEAINISVAYGLFHWGPIAWAFFALTGLTVAYCFHKKQRRRLQLSHVLSDVIGEKNTHGFLGKSIDIASIFFTFCTFGPSLGFGVPVLTTLISNLTGLPNNNWLQFGVLFVWTAIFTTSIYKGLEKGIKVLSDINMVLLAMLLVMVFVLSDPHYILNSIVEQTGTLASNFIRMSTFTDAFRGGSFAQDWTVFYWIWWIVEIPFMSIFIARVSRGRTIRELLFAIVGAGSVGTWSVFWTLGNYAMKLQTSGTLDLADLYQTYGSTETVLATMNSLPFSKIVSVVMIMLFFVFLATCIDSGAFTMGCIASKDILDGQQPTKFNRATWAVSIALLGIAVFRLGGGITAIQTIVIVVGLPAAALLILLVYALFKWLREDYPKEYR